MPVAAAYEPALGLSDPVLAEQGHHSRRDGDEPTGTLGLGLLDHDLRPGLGDGLADLEAAGKWRRTNRDRDRVNEHRSVRAASARLQKRA